MEISKIDGMVERSRESKLKAISSPTVSDKSLKKGDSNGKRNCERESYNKGRTDKLW